MIFVRTARNPISDSLNDELFRLGAGGQWWWGNRCVGFEARWHDCSKERRWLLWANCRHCYRQALLWFPATRPHSALWFYFWYIFLSGFLPKKKDTLRSPSFTWNRVLNSAPLYLLCCLVLTLLPIFYAELRLIVCRCDYLNCRRSS